MMVKQLMNEPVSTCQPEDNLHTAAQLMWDRDYGVLPVVDAGGQVVGMITDRDICMAAFLQGKLLYDIPVSEVMSKRVYSCGPEDSIEEAEKRMREAGVRRLPVLEAGLRLVGLISLNDLARAAVNGARRKGVGVNPAEVATTLAGICQPRSCGERDLRF